jgi:hypothetical protein
MRPSSGRALMAVATRENVSPGMAVNQREEARVGFCTRVISRACACLHARAKITNSTRIKLSC